MPTNTKINNSLAKALFGRLGELGFPKRYVQDVVLPPWWDESFLDDPASLLETRLRLSTYLGLKEDFLEVPETNAFAQTSGHFKGGHPSDPGYQTIKSLACRVAEFAAHGCPTKFGELLPAPLVRKHLLETWGEPWVSFETLAKLCWVQGIPVVHLTKLPISKGIRKPHAMCVKTKSGRPVILLFRNIKSPHWLLWDLAHEIGHIASGHLVEPEAVVWDEKLDYSGRLDWTDDGEWRRIEGQANIYASELLTSEADFLSPVSIGQPDRTARSAFHTAQQMNIDPGYLILRAASQSPEASEPERKRDFALAQTALKKLPGDSSQVICNTLLFTHISEEQLPGEQLRFLRAVTQSE